MSSPVSYAFYLDPDDPGSYWAFPDPAGYADSVDFQAMASSPEAAERALAKARFADAGRVETMPGSLDPAVATRSRGWRVKWLPAFASHKAYVAWSRKTWLKARRASR